jgi:hypothetical protein
MQIDADPIWQRIGERVIRLIEKEKIEVGPLVAHLQDLLRETGGVQVNSVLSTSRSLAVSVDRSTGEL